MRLQTIRSRDGKQIHHGTLVWRKGDEFGFVPQGVRAHGEWWCKEDFWEFSEGDIPLFKIMVRFE